MPVVSFEEFLKQAGGKPLDVKVVQPTETVEPTKKSLGEKIITPAKESIASLLELYGGGERGIATKLKEDIKAGTEDIGKGDVLKGVAKAGFRTAGDVAGTIYAPIGALLGATGLNKVFEKVGEVSQMGGKFNPINLITDIPEVQQFVEKHPNLEEDFGRMANLIMAGLEKGKIEPLTVIPRTIGQAKAVGETIVKPIKITKDFVSGIKQKAQEKVMSDLNKNVDELLTQTKGIQGKVKLAEQKNTQIGEVLKDPNVYKGLKVENNKIVPDEAISVIDNRIERLLNAKKEIISEIDDFVPKTSKKIVKQRAINEINADTKITPADKGSVVEAINKQLDFLPDELSVKELDQFRATFRQSARDAKGLLKRSSEYATLEKAFRDTEFMVTDNLQTLGIDQAGQFKSLNNYVKDMINTKEFLDKTLRGQTVKGGRAGIIAGRVVGAIAGSQGGILTAILGSEAGGFIAKILTNNQLGSSVKLRLIKNMTDNPQILKQVEEFLAETKDYTPLALPPAEKGGFRTTAYDREPIRLPAKPESVIRTEEQARIQAQLKAQRENPNISRQNTAKTTITTNKNISKDNLAQLYQEARKYKSAEEFVKAQESKYRGVHEAPTRSDGDSVAPAFALDRIYPADIYSSKATQYYSSGMPYDAETIGLLQSVKGKPNATITVYRAVPGTKTNAEMIAGYEAQKRAILKNGRIPDAEMASKYNLKDSSTYYDFIDNEIQRLKGAPEPKIEKYAINEGDWVTPNRKYAVDHGMSNLGGNYKILSKKVRADELFTDANSIQEFGYSPRDSKALTKSQITDIWNKANEKGFFKGGIKGNIDQSKTYVITDVRNKFVGHYVGDKNSVDSFVKKLGTGYQYKKMNE